MNFDCPLQEWMKYHYTMYRAGSMISGFCGYDLKFPLRLSFARGSTYRRAQICLEHSSCVAGSLKSKYRVAASFRVLTLIRNVDSTFLTIAAADKHTPQNQSGVEANASRSLLHCGQLKIVAVRQERDAGRIGTQTRRSRNECESTQRKTKGRGGESFP